MKRRFLDQFGLMRAFILSGNIGVPLAAICLFFLGQKTGYDLFFMVFILFHSFERVWETFFTTKERKIFRFDGDWTLAVVTACYLLLCFSAIFEFYLYPRHKYWGVTALGLILYGLAFRLRWWGMKCLGKQWAIHAVGAQKIKKVRLIKVGVYKYIRHPIYLGICIEVLSIPLIGNAYLSCLFALIVNIPLQLIRLKEEEKSTSRRLGKSYQDYREEVSALLPIKYLLKKIKA